MFNVFYLPLSRMEQLHSLRPVRNGHLEVVRLLLESGAKDLPHKVIRLYQL